MARDAAGFHASVMPWLKQRDVALLGNDAVNDVQPSRVEGNGRPIHQLAIVAMGLPLVDVMDLEAAAETAARLKRWEFLLTAAPVPVPGGTGFPAESDRDVLSDDRIAELAENVFFQTERCSLRTRAVKRFV